MIIPIIMTNIKKLVDWKSNRISHWKNYKFCRILSSDTESDKL